MIPISVFKDAADALDKLVDAVGKLGALLKSATQNGVLLFDSITARRTWGALTSFSVRLGQQQQSQRRLFMPMLQEFVETPTAERWASIKGQISQMLESIEEMTKVLNTAAPAIATSEFYPVLFGTLIERKSILTKLVDSPQPATPDDIKAIKDFLTHYDSLIDELIKAGNAMNEYLDAMKLDGKYPQDIKHIRFGRH